MKKQDINEDVSAKLNALTAETQNNRTALNTIGARLGIVMDEKGEYLMDYDGQEFSPLSLEGGGNAVTSASPAPALDVATFAREVVDKLKEEGLLVKDGQQSDSDDTMNRTQSNIESSDDTIQPMKDLLKEYLDAFAKLHGYKVIEVGGGIVFKTDDDPMIRPNPYRDDSPSGKADKSEAMPSSLRGLLAAVCRRLWQDAVSCFWKSFAYAITLLSIIICVSLWWQGKQETKQMEKQYLVYRYVLEADSNGYTIPPILDNDIKNYGIDDVLDYYKQRAEKKKSSLDSEKIKQQEAVRKKQWQNLMKSLIK